MKVILGAGKTNYSGWIATQEAELNLLHKQDFERMFEKRKVSAFLAEHVWEHMTFEEGCEAARNCYEYLEPGGYVRAAVPDANFRNEWYQNMVKVGGNGDPKHPAYSHRIVYDYKSFEAVFKQAGFDVTLLEWCDENGEFHFKDWSAEEGMIGRSLRFDTRNRDGKLGMVSIILDARKPAEIEQNMGE